MATRVLRTLLLLLAPWLLPCDLAAQAAPAVPKQRAFVANHGQWNTAARFASTRTGQTVVVFDDFLRMARMTSSANGTSRPDVVEFHFEQCNPSVSVRGDGAKRGEHDFLIGNDPNFWKRGVPATEAVRYVGLYDGIDLRVHSAETDLEYDLIVAPGADLSRVRVRCEGIEALSVTADGSLSMRRAGEVVRQRPPITWSIARDGRTTERTARYRILDAHTFGFACDELPTDETLVIDPVVTWDTYLGVASGRDVVTDVHVAGRTIVVLGYTTATQFWTTPSSAYQNQNANPPTTDLFVSVFDRARPAPDQLIYSTHLGGSGDDMPTRMAVDAQGVITICGSTRSRDFPTTPTRAYQTQPAGIEDGFICRLDRSRAPVDQLVYGALIGGNGNVDEIRAVVLDGARIHATGVTTSANFPTTSGAFHTAPRGGQDVVIFTLDTTRPPGQQLVYGSYFGSDDDDEPFALAMHPPTGHLLVAGATLDGNSPQSFDLVAGSFMTRNSTGVEGFFARFDPSGRGALDLPYSTYIGGSQDDAVYDIAVTAGGRIFIAGTTQSINFPDLHLTPNIYDPSGDGSVNTFDGFVLEVVPDVAGSRFQQVPYWTYLSGSGNERVTRVAPYGEVGVIAVGVTDSTDFPVTTGAMTGTALGGDDAFLLILHADNGTVTPAAQLAYSTYLGGTGTENAVRLADDGLGTPIVAFETDSSIATRSPSFQSDLAGQSDVYLAQVRVPAIRVTNPSPASAWSLNSEHVIRWSHDVVDVNGTPVNLTGDRVDIEISRDGGPWQTIAQDVPNEGAYTWRVECSQMAAATQANVRVKSRSLPIYSGQSATFEVVPLSSDLVIEKAQLKIAGPGRDSLKLQGLVDVSPILSLNPRTITQLRPGSLTIRSTTRDVTFAIAQLEGDGKKWNAVIDAGTGSFAFLLDAKGRFKLQGKKLDLSGISDPARVDLRLETEELGTIEASQVLAGVPTAKFSLGKDAPSAGVFYVERARAKGLASGGFQFDVRGMYWPPQGDANCPSTLGSPPSVSLAVGNLNTLTLGSWLERGSKWSGSFADPNGDHVEVVLDPVKGTIQMKGSQSGLALAGNRLAFDIVIDGVPARGSLKLNAKGSSLRYP
ncbi:MAG: hypothetical protein H6834_18535 [Planctomycetes bacterium]|nr:hypothetical protein [Planctomycetota bacterium]